ncbi:MAG: glutamine--fructose-6-phosphate aminotransferase, partial [Phycisphaerales bacterium]
MCGIVGYIGKKQCQSLLMEGLKRLEYRGYDSAGIAVIEPTPGTAAPGTKATLRTERAVGRVANLEDRLEKIGGLHGTVGLAHTRWATHGGVTVDNAHPHRDDKNGICLVHNGIIENYATLRTLLEEKGHRFQSQTDTEVLAMLIGELYDPEQGLEAAVQAALREVTGAYAICVICERDPDVMVCARKGSPLMVGIGAGEYVVASDPSAIVAHTTQAMALDDYTVVKITREGFRTSTLDNTETTPKVMQLELELEQIEMGGFQHYMQKEIHEQPKAIRNTLRGRIDEKDWVI